MLHKEDTLWRKGRRKGRTPNQRIRRIDYTRYHLNPKGYMIRISAQNQKEAIAEGLCFEKVGKLFVDAYHKHPEVEAVKLIFITQRR